MLFQQIMGLIMGILAIIAGIAVLIQPKLLSWIVGIFLILLGAGAVSIAVFAQRPLP